MRQAIMFARKGQVHPDADIATGALRWARMVLAAEPAHPELDSSKWRRRLAFMVWSVWLSDDYVEWLRDRSQRRDARTIVAVFDSEGRGSGALKSRPDCMGGVGTLCSRFLALTLMVKQAPGFGEDHSGPDGGDP